MIAACICLNNKATNNLERKIFLSNYKVYSGCSFILLADSSFHGIIVVSLPCTVYFQATFSMF